MRNRRPRRSSIEADRPRPPRAVSDSKAGARGRRRASPRDGSHRGVHRLAAAGDRHHELLQQVGDGNRATTTKLPSPPPRPGSRSTETCSTSTATGYWQYSGDQGKTIPATSGGANPALYGWEAVPNSKPQGSSPTRRTRASSQWRRRQHPFGGQVLFVVTGAAGNGAMKAYRRIEASFSLSGVLTDLYFSNFEQPGPATWTSGRTPTRSALSGMQCPQEVDEYDEATATTPPAGAHGVTRSSLTRPRSASMTPCAEHLHRLVQPERLTCPTLPTAFRAPRHTAPPTLLRPVVRELAGSAQQRLVNSASAPTSGKASGDQSACNENYYISSATLSTARYTALDELTTCGTPSFTGAPALQTAIASAFPFPGGWPGTRPAVGGVSYPYGYVEDPWGECGTRGTVGDSPKFRGQTAQVRARSRSESSRAFLQWRTRSPRTSRTTSSPAASTRGRR